MFLKLIDCSLILNNIIIITGLFGAIFNKKNILIILIFIEIIFIGLNLNFVIISLYLDDIVGHLFVIFILTVAAGESAVILSLLILLFKFKNLIDLKFLNLKIKL